MWNKDEIANKWPAARLVGPNVTVEQAEDYIWKTDHALQSPRFACNDREFCHELAEWVGYPSDTEQTKWEAWSNTCDRRGWIELTHLESNWVASSYIFGPTGPVHPNGEVRLCKNFGKWPSIEEVETDLAKVAEAFRWLRFTLALWDSPDEDEAVDRGDQPDFAWKLTDGGFERIPAEGAFDSIPIPRPPSIEQAVMGVLGGGRKETTWPMSVLKDKWGHLV